MGERANKLADDFDKAVEDFAKTIQGCSDEKWKAKTLEGYTVGVLAQHVSGQFPLEREYIVAAAEGFSMPTYSWDDINHKNDTRAARNAGVSKAEVVNELRDGAKEMGAYIRGLSDDQLDSKGALPLANGAEVSAQQLIEGGVLIDHVRTHLKSIEAAG